MKSNTSTMKMYYLKGRKSTKNLFLLNSRWETYPIGTVFPEEQEELKKSAVSRTQHIYRSIARFNRRVSDKHDDIKSVRLVTSLLKVVRDDKCSAVQLYESCTYPISVFIAQAESEKLKDTYFESFLPRAAVTDSLELEMPRNVFETIQETCAKRDGLKYDERSGKKDGLDPDIGEWFMTIEKPFDVVVFDTLENKVLARAHYVDPTEKDTELLKALLKMAVPTCRRMTFMRRQREALKEQDIELVEVRPRHEPAKGDEPAPEEPQVQKEVGDAQAIGKLPAPARGAKPSKDAAKAPHDKPAKKQPSVKKLRASFEPGKEKPKRSKSRVQQMAQDFEDRNSDGKEDSESHRQTGKASKHAKSEREGLEDEKLGKDELDTEKTSDVVEDGELVKANEPVNSDEELIRQVEALLIKETAIEVSSEKVEAADEANVTEEVTSQQAVNVDAEISEELFGSRKQEEEALERPEGAADETLEQISEELFGTPKYGTRFEGSAILLEHVCLTCGVNCRHARALALGGSVQDVHEVVQFHLTPTTSPAVHRRA